MSYVDYKFYKENFNGASIPEQSFNKLAIEASRKIKCFTFNRITEDTITEDIKLATCSVADTLYKQEQLKNKIQDEKQKELSSETVGPHSKSYVNKSNLQTQLIKSERELNKTLYQICKEYLSDTDLMYPGI